MKTKQQIEDFIAKIVEEVSLEQRKASEVRPEHRIIADLGFDSLDYAMILLRCEKWLEIKVQENGVDWSRIATVGDLAQFIEQQQKP
jgi:acyl carrier protein